MKEMKFRLMIVKSIYSSLNSRLSHIFSDILRINFKYVAGTNLTYSLLLCNVYREVASNTPLGETEKGE